MTGLQSREAKAAALAGATSLALLIGALLFQYAGGLPPCPMCHWQRWPHIAAAILGLGSLPLIVWGVLPAAAARPIALVAIGALIASGAIGVFHAGVEWDWWEGPASCVGSGYVPGQDEVFRIVRCDEAAWRDRLLGVSLAGYNALISFAAAGVALWLLRRKGV